MQGDKEAKNKLIEHNLRLVAHIAKKYSSNEQELEDLISIGSIGLIKAINSFSGEKNFKVSTYASRCIENEILMYLRSSKKIKSEVSMNTIIGTDKDGNEKYIEVKTTKGGLNNIFHISENEVEFSEQYKDKYYLYRVYNFNIKTMSADLKIIKGAINREKLQATNYTCRIGGK